MAYRKNTLYVFGTCLPIAMIFESTRMLYASDRLVPNPLCVRNTDFTRNERQKIDNDCVTLAFYAHELHG